MRERKTKKRNFDQEQQHQCGVHIVLFFFCLLLHLFYVFVFQRNLVAVVGSGSEILLVYEKALQEAREAGTDMQTLQEYTQCVEARAKIEVSLFVFFGLRLIFEIFLKNAPMQALLEQRRREAEERERVLQEQAVEQQLEMEALERAKQVDR